MTSYLEKYMVLKKKLIHAWYKQEKKQQTLPAAEEVKTYKQNEETLMNYGQQRDFTKPQIVLLVRNLMTAGPRFSLKWKVNYASLDRNECSLTSDLQIEILFTMLLSCTH